MRNKQVNLKKSISGEKVVELLRRVNSDEKAAALVRLKDAYWLCENAAFMTFTKTVIRASFENCEWNETLEREWQNVNRRLAEFETCYADELIDAAKQFTEVVMKERGYNVIYEKIE